MTIRNSERTGSSASRETMRKQSPTGMPVRMPRTTTSTALGNSFVNLAMRRLRRWRSRNIGTPRPPTKAPPSAGDRARGDQQHQQAAHDAASPAETIQ